MLQWVVSLPIFATKPDRHRQPPHKNIPAPQIKVCREAAPPLVTLAWANSHSGL